MLTRLRARARAVRASGDAGVTLAELLVTMTLGTIIGAMTMNMFLAVNTAADRTTDATVNTGRARVLIQSWSNYLHVADGTTPGSTATRFEWLGAQDMLFYANLYNRTGPVNSTGSPTMVWLRLDGAGNLVEEQFPVGSTSGAAPTVCRRLSARATSARLFTPSAGQNDLSTTDLGTVPTSGTGCQPLPVTPPSVSGTSDPVAVANLRTVTRIGIDFTLAARRGATTQQFSTDAILPTLGGTA